MSETADAPLQALFHPFVSGQLQWPSEGAVLLAHGRPGPALIGSRWRGLAFEQDHRGLADALRDAGLPQAQAGSRGHPLILLLPPRQREHARASLARALLRLADGGVLVLAQANSDGGRSIERDLRQLCSATQVLPKHQCRVCWTPAGAAIDQGLLQDWAALDAIRPIAEGRFLSRPGVFAWDRIDAGSALLAAQLPRDLAGPVADLGAGWGYLACEMLERCPAIGSLDLYEVDARALDLARQNVAQLLPAAAGSVQVSFHWHDVLAGLPSRYRSIVCNPPFHAQQGRARVDLGRRFLQVAAAALLPGGEMWLVANRHLPYEGVLGEHFALVDSVAQAEGYKILRARQARPRAGSTTPRAHR